MSAYLRKHKGGIAFSLALHIALVALLAINLDFSWQREAPPGPAPIQVEIFDAKEYEAAVQKKEEEQLAREAAEAAARQKAIDDQREREMAAQRERDRLAREQEQARVAKLEADRIEKERVEKLERDRIEAQRKAEEARKEQERKAEEARKEQERVAEQRRQEEARRREEQQRAAREAAERQRAAEAEAARVAAARADALAKYRRDITNKITTKWVRPLSAQPGLECVVRVNQLPSGDIISSQVVRCNGDAAVTQSVENAVKLASPLPRPDDPAVFSRELEVIFAPVVQ